MPCAISLVWAHHACMHTWCQTQCVRLPACACAGECTCTRLRALYAHELPAQAGSSALARSLRVSGSPHSLTVPGGSWMSHSSLPLPSAPTPVRSSTGGRLTALKPASTLNLQPRVDQHGRGAAAAPVASTGMHGASDAPPRANAKNATASCVGPCY